MNKKFSKKYILIIICFAIALFLIYYYFNYYGKETTDDAALEANVVAISAKVSGYIKKINVEDNQAVKAGEIILEIEPVDYELTRDKLAADLKVSEAKLQSMLQNLESIKITAPSNLESARFQMQKAQVDWEKAVNDLNRVKKLDSFARSIQQLDDATSNEKATAATLESAKALFKSSQNAPQIILAAEYNAKELEAAVNSAKADLEQANNNIKYTKVIAPFDGKITNRGIEIGSYVQPGQQLLSLVSQNFWVVANFKETQLTNMKPGQKVDITIDAYPDKRLTGKVDSIQAGTGGRFTIFPSENATGNFVKIVQRVPVKIVFDDNKDNSLIFGAGMSVVPIVHIK